MDESLRKELKRKLVYFKQGRRNHIYRTIYQYKHLFYSELDKRKLKARNAGDLAEEAKLCNVAGELLSEHSKDLMETF